jgi:hypothetical protein
MIAEFAVPGKLDCLPLIAPAEKTRAILDQEELGVTGQGHDEISVKIRRIGQDRQAPHGK